MGVCLSLFLIYLNFFYPLKLPKSKGEDQNCAHEPLSGAHGGGMTWPVRGRFQWVNLVAC